MDIKNILKQHAYCDIPLSYADAYDLGVFTINACKNTDAKLEHIQSTSALCALHHKALYAYGCGNQTIAMPEQWWQSSQIYDASAQIAGLCAAVFEHDIAKTRDGFVNPNTPFVVDNCGMGGDLTTTANVSTLASFIAATAGVPVCKHGSPSNADAGKHGSSDFIEMCGIDPYQSKSEVEKSIETENFGFIEALNTRHKRIHLQTHEVAKLPHMNDIIGVMTNPVNPMKLTKRIVGANHLIPPPVIARAYHILNQKGITNMENLFVVRGFGDDIHSGGMDELSICPGGTLLTKLSGTTMSTRRILPAEFGIDPVSVKSIAPPEGMSKGDFSMKILRGEISGPPLQMVLANAALLLHLVDENDSLADCYKMAKDVFDSGDVLKKVHGLSSKKDALLAAE